MVLEGVPPTIPALVRALDELALAAQDAPEAYIDDNDNAPPSQGMDGYKATYARLAERFPNLGHYGVADPLEVPGEPMVGDAIDDLADIVGDLEKVLWRYENISVADAHSEMQFSFKTHWGRHLRELGLYLHALQMAEQG